MPVESEGFAPEPAEEVDDTPLQPRKVKARKPVYRVRKVTDTGDDPQITKFDTLGEAHRYVETNHPRGREVYVEHPDGYQEHFSADHKAQGHEQGGWFELSEDEVE